MSAPAEPRPEPRTAREMLARGREFLAKKGVEEARLEAELLVAHADALAELRDRCNRAIAGRALAFVDHVDDRLVLTFGEVRRNLPAHP